MARSDAMSDLLAASIPATQRAELDAAEAFRTRHWLERLAAASGHGEPRELTARQRHAAQNLIEGAGADTLRTVAALLEALNDD